jgi:hypothetical protein
VSTSAWAPPRGYRPLRPRHLSRRRQVHQQLRLLYGEYQSLSRVLTFDDAGLGQRSSSSRCFGLCLGGRSGLISGRHDFFLRHRRRGLISLLG